MHDIEKEYRERVNANKKMRYEIKDLKMHAGSGKRAGIYEVRFYSLVGTTFSKIWSQPSHTLCGCSRGTVKLKTMNFCSHNALSIILITLRRSLAYWRTILTSSSVVHDPLN